MQDDMAKAAGSALKFVVSYVLWSLVLFNLGRVVLLICTLGRYPRGKALVEHVNRISFVGVLVIVGLWVSIAVHNNLVHV
jgi:hypothetical protein